MLKNQLGDFHPWPKLYREWPDVIHFQIEPPCEALLYCWCCDMDGQSEAGETALTLDTSRNMPRKCDKFQCLADYEAIGFHFMRAEC